MQIINILDCIILEILTFIDSYIILFTVGFRFNFASNVSWVLAKFQFKTSVISRFQSDEVIKTNKIEKEK